MTSHCPLRDDAAAWVLGALPDAEVVVFARHLDNCGTCRETVAGLGDPAGLLPMAVDSLEPPPELKDRVMATVRAEAELLRAGGPSADRPSPRRRRFAVAPALAAALASAALAVVVITSDDEQPPPTRTIAATTTLSGATARVELIGERGRLVLRGVPKAPAGRTYEIWVMRPGKKPRPAGTFAAGPETVSTEIGGDIRGAEQVLVTVEPVPGRSQPTSAPVIAAEIS